MTNEQTQLIGISAAAFAHATEDQRVEWGKANTTAGFGLCGPALVWLKTYQGTDALGAYSHVQKEVRTFGGDVVEPDGCIYRLAPDYQPPAKRWWFDTAGLTVVCHENKPYWKCIEVTAEYAAYVQAKPEEECELREVRKGDTFFNFLTDQWGYAKTGTVSSVSGVPALRWCKPREVAGWRWWFCEGSHEVHHGLSQPCKWCIEVTAEYAAYLQAKPEGEWELRKPEDKDEYMTFGTSGHSAKSIWTKLADVYTQDAKYRWCKPRQVAGWVEYPVEAVNGVYCVIGLNNGKWRLDKAANRVGFGGVQFEGYNGWYMVTRAGITKFGVLEFLSATECDRLAVPVRCRFWEVPQ